VLLIQLAPADVSNAPILVLLLAIGSVALVVTCPTPYSVAFSRNLKHSFSYVDYQIFQVNFCNRSFGWTQGEIRTKSSSRLLSLDTFRGMCLMIMIFVNYGKILGIRAWVVFMNEEIIFCRWRAILVLQSQVFAIFFNHKRIA